MLIRLFWCSLGTAAPFFCTHRKPMGMDIPCRVNTYNITLFPLPATFFNTFFS